MKGMRACATLSTVLVVAFLPGAVVAWEVCLHADVTTRAAIVRLGDVADIAGDDLPAGVALEQIVVALGPTRTHTRELTSSDLRRTLAQRGVDLQRCQFTGAPRSVLTYGSESTSANPDHALRDGAARPMLPGRTREARAPKLIPVVVPVRPLVRGEMVRAADVELRYVDKASASGVLVQRIADAVGHQTRQSVSADQPLSVRALQQPLLVRKNEEVDVVVRCGAIQAHRRAVALQDGARGDMITVETKDDSKAQFNARVVDIRQAEVLPNLTSVGR